MEFNYALERSKFEKRWSALRKQYTNAGMEKEAIDKMYDFDLMWFNSERRYIRRQAELPDGVTVEDLPDPETVIPDYTGTATRNTDRRWWLNEIENEELLRRLSILTDVDIDLITALVYEGKTQSKLAQIYGCSQRTISKHLYKIKKILKYGSKI